MMIIVVRMLVSYRKIHSKLLHIYFTLTQYSMNFKFKHIQYLFMPHDSALTTTLEAMNASIPLVKAIFVIFGQSVVLILLSTQRQIIITVQFQDYLVIWDFNMLIYIKTFDCPKVAVSSYRRLDDKSL